MASIGGIPLTSVGTILPAYATGAHRLITRPGGSGIGVLYDAWRVPPIDLEATIQVAQPADIRRALHALEGTHTTIVDQFGNTYAQTFVVAVATEVHVEVGGQYVFRLRARVLLDRSRAT